MSPPERKRIHPALSNSYEALFHSTGLPRFWLKLRDNTQATEKLHQPRLERAIGVIYLPQCERVSHYFKAHLYDQFDAIIHFDETRGLEPLERTPQWETGEAPETYPFAF